MPNKYGKASNATLPGKFVYYRQLTQFCLEIWIPNKQYWQMSIYMTWNERLCAKGVTELIVIGFDSLPEEAQNGVRQNAWPLS